MPDKPFVIVQPEFIRNYRQEHFMMSQQKEKIYLALMLVSLVLLGIGLL